MKKVLLFALSSLFMIITFTAVAQDEFKGHCSDLKSNSSFLNKKNYHLLVAHPAEHDYDINYIHIDIVSQNQNINISGNALIKAKVVSAAGLGQYVFELNQNYIIDSIKINGINKTFSRSSTIVFVPLTTALPIGAEFTAKVYYRGSAIPGSDGYSLGIINAASPSWGNRITYTLTQPFGAKDWFPVKQSLTDKIDSARIFITVPDTLKAGSNGILQQVTTMPGNKKRYEWKTRYPIDYYLLSFAVGNYVEYNYNAFLPISGDSLLVQNYIYSNPSALTYWQPFIDSVGFMITYFSELFGDYPFSNEKYGHSMAPFSGGMEHQTMTTQGNFTPTLSAHELGHQWFGNHITCASWADIWLNEGFASYLEYLYLDHFNGTLAGIEKMNDVHNNVMSAVGGTVYCYDSTNETRIFNHRLTYDKGSAVAHSLRFMVDNDSLYFAMLRKYMNDFGGGNATTEHFKNHCESFTGLDLNIFFDQWVKKEGFPTYNLKWNKLGDLAIFQLSQSTSVPTSVSFFSSPLEIKFISSDGSDTTLRVNNMLPLQTFSINWSNDINEVVIDPNNWILNKIGTLSYDPNLTLSIENENAKSITVFPNPTTSVWIIQGLADAKKAILFDNNGKMIQTYYPINGTISIPAAALASGTYTLEIINENKKGNLSLVKK